MEFYSVTKKNENLPFTVNGWNQRISFYVKLVRLRRPNAACFLSYVKYGYKSSIIMKSRSHQGEVTHERSRVKIRKLRRCI
jgi:hypothetical protein